MWNSCMSWCSQLLTHLPLFSVFLNVWVSLQQMCSNWEETKDERFWNTFRMLHSNSPQFKRLLVWDQQSSITAGFFHLRKIPRSTHSLYTSPYPRRISFSWFIFATSDPFLSPVLKNCLCDHSARMCCTTFVGLKTLEGLSLSKLFMEHFFSPW